MDGEDPDGGRSPLSRRSFVKGAVYASAGFALGGYALQNAASTIKPASTRVVAYRGVLNVGGPAPRPLPLVPLALHDDGALAGRADHLDWLWYCGLNKLPPIRPDAPVRDGLFRYAEAPEGTSAWYDALRGEVMNRQDFLDRAEASGGAPVGAGGTWREQGGTSIPVIVIYLGEQAPDAAVEGFLATSGKCVHLCCVPGFNVSPQRFAKNADDRIFCICHGSIYDARTVVESTYLAELPPDESD